MSVGPVILKKDQEQREVQTVEFRDINIDYSSNSISCISNLVYDSVAQYDAATWGACRPSVGLLADRTAMKRQAT
jgi:hypothetical protein